MLQTLTGTIPQMSALSCCATQCNTLQHTAPIRIKKQFEPNTTTHPQSFMCIATVAAS